jgi:hypothetical protein
VLYMVSAQEDTLEELIDIWKRGLDRGRVVTR